MMKSKDAFHKDHNETSQMFVAVGRDDSKELTTDTGPAENVDQQKQQQQEQQQQQQQTQQQQWLALFYQKYATGRPLPDRYHTINITNALMNLVVDNNESNHLDSLSKEKCSNHIIDSLTNNSDENPIQTQQTLPHVDSLQLPRPVLQNVYGPGPILLSDIPESCRNSSSSCCSDPHRNKVVIGIDEAGRGCVLGPMVYGAAFWNQSVYENSIVNQLEKNKNGLLLTDSKKLTDMKRCDLMDQLIVPSSEIGYACRIIHANEISRNMSRVPIPYNLNQMSHDAAIQLIYTILQAGVTNIDTIYIDTVGTVATYQKKLEQEFQFHSPPINFIVESKADDTYPCCSAASIGTSKNSNRVIDR
jgi:ribonuclease HII